jgi:hypothetical protein
MGSEREPKLPCIQVCLLDKEDICVGCYRSAEEITDSLMAFMVDVAREAGDPGALQRAADRAGGQSDCATRAGVDFTRPSADADMNFKS